MTITSTAAKDAVHYPAALAAVDLVRDSTHLERDATLALESRTFGGVATTANAATLIHLFVSDQAMKKSRAANSNGA